MNPLLQTNVTVTLEPGASVVVTHGLVNGDRALIPNYVQPDHATAIGVSTYDSTTVTFVNYGDEPDEVDFEIRRDHTYQRPISDTGGVIWRGTSSAGGASVLSQPTPRMSRDSFCPGDLLCPLWATQYPAQTPMREPSGLSNGEGFLEAVLVNPDGQAPATGGLGWSFVAPPDVTRMRWTYPAADMPGTSGNVLILYVYTQSSPGNTLLTYLIQPVTATLTDYEIEFDVTPGVRYELFPFFNSLTYPQQKILSGRPKLEIVTGGSGFFATGFYRYDLLPDDWQSNLYRDIVQSVDFITTGYTTRYFVAGMSRLTFRTVTTEFTIEYLSNDWYGADVARQFQIYVNGQFWGVVTPPLSPNGGGVAGYLDVTGLPAGLKTIEIISGQQTVLQGTPPIPEPYPIDADPDNVPFALLRTIYSPTQLEFTRQTPTSTVLLIGDDNAEGTGTTTGQGARRCLVQQLRGALDPHSMMFADCWETQTVWKNAGTPTLRTDYARRVRQAGITDLVFAAIGFWDFYYAGTAYDFANVADFQTAFDDWLVAINAASPSTRILVYTPLNSSNDAAMNGVGEVIADYRTAVTNACAGKAYVTVVDGLAIFPDPAAVAIYYFGLYQLNEQGYTKFASTIKAALDVL